MRLFPAIVFALVALISTAAFADSWKVVRVSGRAWIVSKDSQALITAGTDLPVGATVSTGRSARVLLQKNNQTIMVGPGTTMAISASPGAGLKTTVLQQSGTIEVEVEKRNVRYFSVETPLLAAVVKGTRFVVSVGGKEAEVEVKRGRVQVTDLATGATGDVNPGQKATSSSRGFTVTGPGAKMPIHKGKPRAPVVDAAGTSNPGNSGDSGESDDDSENNGNHGNGNNGDNGNHGDGNNGDNGNHGNGNNGSNGNHGSGNNGNGGGNGNND